MPPKSSSKKNGSSRKKPSSKVPISPEKNIMSMIKTEKDDVDINALITEHLATNDSSNASPSKKRKNRSGSVVVSSDDGSSDLELLEGPATPIKKRLRKMTPPPGSDAFKQLEAVTTSPSLKKAMSSTSTSHIEFGSVKIVDNVARPKRVTVRTSKAEALEAAKALAAKTRSPFRSALEPAAILSPTAVRKTVSSASTKAPVPVDMENVLSESEHIADANELPDVAKVFSDVMRMKRGKDKAPPPPSAPSERGITPLPDSLAIEDLDWSNSNPDLEASDAEAGELNMAVKTANTKPVATEIVTIAEDSDSQYDQGSNSGNIDESLVVMLPSCQDPMLAPTYRKLPKIPRLCEVVSFTPCIESLRTPFGATCKNMRQEEIRAFLKALLFVKSGQFVNTARIDPALLIVENSRLRIRDKKSLAICIMTGTLTESFVVESCEAGPRHSPYSIHKVTIAPLEQDWRRDVSVWGMLFDFHVISGMLSESGFGFATRGEGKGEGWKTASAPSSPVKKRPSSSVLKAVSSPSIARTGDSIVAASRSFDDRILVYDGRARNGQEPFMYTDSDFRDLSSWPLYRKGSSDIPADSVVSVGYSLSTYKGASGLVLSSNVHFVIVISTPALS